MVEIGIWQQAEWPDFRWQDAEVLPRLRRIQYHPGILQGYATCRTGNAA